MQPVAFKIVSKVLESTESFIHGKDLAISYSATPPVEEVTEEVASRFFSKKSAANKNDMARRESTVPKTANPIQSHECTEITKTYLAKEEKARDPSIQTMSTHQQHDQQDEPPPGIFEPNLERSAEVDPSLYQPPRYQYRPDPITHHFSIHARVSPSRNCLQVLLIVARYLCMSFHPWLVLMVSEAQLEKIRI